MPYLTFVKWWIVDFEIEFSKYYLIMAVLVKRRVDTRTHYQIWLKGEDKSIQGTDVSWMWVGSLIICCSLNWEVMASFLEPSKGSCITSIPVARLCVEITNNNWNHCVEMTLRWNHQFLRTRSNGDKEAYNKQRNYCVTFIQKTKQENYNNLDHRKVADNRSFWKYIKPLFSGKSSNCNKITLVEKDLILEKNVDIAETFNDFFTSVVSKLNIPRYSIPLLIVTDKPNRTPDSQDNWAIEKLPQYYGY